MLIFVDGRTGVYTATPPITKCSPAMNEKTAPIWYTIWYTELVHPSC